MKKNIIFRYIHLIIMENIKEKIEKHLAHDDFLTKDEVLFIIEKFTEFKYEGEAYRVLFFSNKTNECELSEDSSFSHDIKGIKYYSFKQDLDYYKYAQLYKVKLLGLDLYKILKFYNVKNFEMADNEKEIVLGKLYEQELIFNDESLKLDSIL